MRPSPGEFISLDTEVAQFAKLIQAPAGEIPPQPTPPKPAAITALGRDRTEHTPPVTKRYYIPMTIAGQMIYGIHGTGCTYSIMSIKLAEALGLMVKPYAGTFQVANDDYSSCKGGAKYHRVPVADFRA